MRAFDGHFLCLHAVWRHIFTNDLPRDLLERQVTVKVFCMKDQVLSVIQISVLNLPHFLDHHVAIFIDVLLFCQGLQGDVWQVIGLQKTQNACCGFTPSLNYAQSTDVKEHFAVNPTVINNSQLQQISVFQVRLKTVLTIAEYQRHYGSIQVIHSAAFLFQCTSITSSNKRKKTLMVTRQHV